MELRRSTNLCFALLLICNQNAFRRGDAQGNVLVLPAREDPVEINSFDDIVENYADFVYNVGYRMMGKPEDAEDASQDAFISACRAYEHFHGESKVTTWLFKLQ